MSVQHQPAAEPLGVVSRAPELERAPVAISVQDVAKTFRLPHQQYSTLKERALHPLRSQAFDELRALRDVSVDIKQGEFFGIVGRNGSGKSTLLKCLAGIYDLDQGSISIQGRLSPFIELGVGFNPDLTARDNVVINAIMLGLPRKVALERFDDVIRFAELEEFVDLKLKNYSSGMTVRLAFATAIQVDTEVLLVDEVLAVGDAAFQQKCFEEFQRLKDTGRTIVFVTHDMASVERFCDRAMLLEKGEVVEIGEPRTIARRYNEVNFGRPVATTESDLGAVPAEAADDRDRPARVATITRCWFENVNGEAIVSVGQGELLRVRFEALIHEALSDPVFSVVLRNDAHHVIVGLSSNRLHGLTGEFEAGSRCVVTFQFDGWLAPSRYSATPSVALAGTGEATLDARLDMASLVVHGEMTGGVIDLPHTVEVIRT